MVKLESSIVKNCDTRQIHGGYVAGDGYRFLDDDVILLKQEYNHVVIGSSPNLCYARAFGFQKVEHEKVLVKH